MQSHFRNESGNHLAGDGTAHQVQSHEKRNKRFQACVACRATKTKCLPSARQDSCQSCLKHSRPCLTPGPPKPRIKSAQKFSELEKKIELLTNALAAKEHDPQNLPDAVPHDQNDTSSQPLVSSSRGSSPLEDPNSNVQDNAVDDAQLPKPPNTQPDVIDEGLLRKETATTLFLHWKTNMHPYMPLVPVEANNDMEQVRSSRPMLFLAILAVSSSSAHPSLSIEFVKRLTQALGRCTFVQNEPSIDAVLAILLFSQYFFQTDKSTTLPPSQYIYTAVAMIQDLGLHFKAKDVLGTISSTNAEAAQVCLSEWYAASMIAVLLNRTPIVQHSPDLEKYATILHAAPQSPPNWTFSLYKLQQIIERAALLVDPLENKSDKAFDEPGTQYKINMLQQQLESWERELPEDVDERFRKHAFHTAYLRIHAIAIRCYVRKVVIEKQSGNHSRQHYEDGLMGLTPQHFDCISKCLTSIKTVFDIYLSLDILAVRSLPSYYLFWNMGAAVLLIKLSYFGEVLTKHEQQQQQQQQSGNPETSASHSFKATVVYYLDAIAAKMEQAARGGHLPQAKAYIRVLRKLKPYYLQKRAVCISSEGEAIAIDGDEACSNTVYPYSIQKQSKAGNAASPPVTNVQVQSETGNNQMYHHSPTTTQQTTQSSAGNHSQAGSGWTPSSFSSQGAFYTPSNTGSHNNDLFTNPSTNVNSAYDPYKYTDMDWTDAFTLDQEAMQQLDEFMWAEEDAAWMQSLL